MARSTLDLSERGRGKKKKKKKIKLLQRATRTPSPPEATDERRLLEGASGGWSAFSGFGVKTDMTWSPAGDTWT